MVENGFELLSREAEAFIKAREQELYLNYAGLKENLDLSAIYQRYPSLATIEAIDQVDRFIAADDPELARRSRYLRLFLVDTYLGQAVKEIEDQLVTRETQAKVEIQGRQISYRYASVLLANEPLQEKRRKIYQVRKAVVEELNPLFKQKIERQHRLVQQLGYTTYVDLYQEVKGQNLRQLAGMAAEILSATETCYLHCLSEASQTYLDLPVEQVKSFDIRRLIRGVWFDPYFTAEGLLPTFCIALAGMGIDIEAQNGIVLDVEARDKKSPRAFCAPIDIPGRVMLVILLSITARQCTTFFRP